MISGSWHAGGQSTPPEGTPACHPSPAHMVPTGTPRTEQPIAPQHIPKGSKPLDGAGTHWGPTSSPAGAAAAPAAARAVAAGHPTATGCSLTPSARRRSQRQVQKHTRWIFSCQVLSATQCKARPRCCEH